MECNAIQYNTIQYNAMQFNSMQCQCVYSQDADNVNALWDTWLPDLIAWLHDYITAYERAISRTISMIFILSITITNSCSWTSCILTFKTINMFAYYAKHFGLLFITSLICFPIFIGQECRIEAKWKPFWIHRHHSSGLLPLTHTFWLHPMHSCYHHLDISFST